MSTAHPITSSSDSDIGDVKKERTESERNKIITTIESVPGYDPPPKEKRKEDRMRIAGLPEVAATRKIIGTRIESRDASRASFGNTELFEVVIGQDDRRPVEDTRIMPWRTICALRILTKTNREYVGTGWLIGPRTVMTAGHCVYLHDEGGWAKSIRVLPGLDGTKKPFGQYTSSDIHSVRQWTEDRNSDTDYGVIFLEEPIGERLGWFAFGVPRDENLTSSEVNICGYPLDRSEATKQYFHARTLARISQRRLYYEIDTFGGQSGAPAWILVGNERVAIGVHTNGSSTSNSATRITPDVFANMREWKEVRNG